jgi:hypothetical protein
MTCRPLPFEFEEDGAHWDVLDVDKGADVVDAGADHDELEDPPELRKLACFLEIGVAKDARLS